MKHQDTASRLREALNDKNMKPQELANLTGINKASISQYVNGTYRPSNLSAGKMAKVLGVSPLWLMGFSVNKIDIEELQNQLIDTRMEYINTPETDSDKLNQLERKIETLEKQIKDAVKLDEKPLKLSLIKSPVGSMPDHTTNKDINEIRKQISNIDTKEATKALLLYQKYQEAPPHIQAAIESLLKGSEPES